MSYFFALVGWLETGRALFLAELVMARASELSARVLRWGDAATTEVALFG